MTKHAHSTTGGTRVPAPPNVSHTAREYRFRGELTNGKNPPEEHEFTVLADNEAVQPSEGYAIYAHIKRPQRKSLTVLEGYEPMKLLVPILFNTLGEEAGVETDIQKLEWMGGRGIIFRTAYEGGFASPGEGNSPLVTVESFDNSGRRIPLMPSQFQIPNLHWVLTEIEWDKEPIREGNAQPELTGHRIRQKAVVTLTEYVAPQFDEGYNSAADRQKAREEVGSAVNIVTVPGNTGKEVSIQSIAAFYCHNVNAVKEILAVNVSNPAIGTTPHKHLKKGTQVAVPRNLIRPRAAAS